MDRNGSENYYLGLKNSSPSLGPHAGLGASRPSTSHTQCSHITLAELGACTRRGRTQGWIMCDVTPDQRVGCGGPVASKRPPTGSRPVGAWQSRTPLPRGFTPRASYRPAAPTHRTNPPPTPPTSSSRFRSSSLIRISSSSRRRICTRTHDHRYHIRRGHCPLLVSSPSGLATGQV